MEDKKETSPQEIQTPIIGDELEKRKEKIISFLKKKTDWIYYGILSFIIFISLYIRTRNISKLKDITTGTWTLGPDLDPFLFLRWAKYIAEHGKLFLIDTMRSVPLAEICQGTQCNPVNTAGEMKLLSYMILGFHKLLLLFSGTDTSITYSAILFPVVMFALTIVAFFLFARKVFYKENKKTRNIIALVSTAFFALIPSLLPRTIAGIPEKESAAFFFIFLGFYFFLEAFTSEKLKRGLIFGALAGISTGLLGLIWGGVIYVFMTIAAAVLFAFLLGKIDEKKFYTYSLWVASFVVIILSFSARYTISSLMGSLSTGLVFMVFFVLLIDLVLFKKKIFKIQDKIRTKLPREIISLIIALIILGILASIFFGVSFIPNHISGIISQTVKPVNNRFAVTVAENKQPYFISDWKNDFGPVWFNIPLYFWLFFTGSVLLFNQMIKSITKKEKIVLVFGYFIFLTGLVFSRYSPSGILNGDSGLSLTVYFGGILFFLGSFAYFYYKRYKEEKLSVFKEFDFSYILYFIIFTMTIIGARGAVRLIMVLGAISPIAVGFLVVKTAKNYLKEKDNTKKFFIGIVVLIILLASIFTLWVYYKQNKNMAENFAPGIYQWQWQKAMAWVRENTQEDSVFAHWWDYGYWVQSIGERATILDGGNTIGYWNHLMGRHVLTGSDEKDSLEFLYAHNTTHLLIDSTEIGKYTAFSSIGSDENYDRFSWITTFLLDERQTYETENETIYVYIGGAAIDEDIIWKENEKEIFLPRKKAAVGAIIIRKLTNEEKILQPNVVIMYNNNQYNIPLRFVYYNNKLYDFSSGLDAGIFLFPKLEQLSDGRVNINPIGALLYLGSRTVHSGIARLYLFDEKSNYFKLAHTESDIFVNDLKQQGYNLGEFIYYQGIRGPIKIWEIKYPSDIKLNLDYLKTEYPPELLTIKPEEYSN